ncbi:hypothetical protein CROQUDRAFT_654071 [Cronartium quercuum f. sp. fusiforme G11]|uniref:Uncharacterized protein n=1 Tax=Cronartium quercuum f. sp. fusiforme G11 TaxID=708437 RepID=A0A9P6NT07_9BASI|nr:hypothetical protein CROQUDRAFT_654071 [Cronartium quercuum f. sp. fusiforme G11]
MSLITSEKLEVVLTRVKGMREGKEEISAQTNHLQKTNNTYLNQTHLRTFCIDIIEGIKRHWKQLLRDASTARPGNGGQEVMRHERVREV